MEQPDANPESWHLVAVGADSPALLGATLGYGLLDEPIEHYGALQQLATALRTELSRPVELADSQVRTAQVQLDIQSDTTLVLLRGDPEVIVAGWQRLAGFFDGQAGWNRPVSHAVDIWGFPTDAVLRAGGSNAFAVSMFDIEPPQQPDPVLDALREKLDPRAGTVSWSFLASSPDLLQVPPFNDLAPRTARPAAARGSGQARPLSIPATGGGVLLTALVPRTEAGLMAAGILLAHLEQCMRATVNVVPALGLSTRGMGTDLWISADLGADLPDAQRHPVISALLAAPIPDPLLDSALAHAPTGQAGQVLRDSERRSIGLPDSPPPSRVQVQQALVRAFQTIHIPIGQGVPPIEGLERFDHMPDRTAAKVFRGTGDPQLARTGLARDLALGPGVVADATDHGFHTTIDLNALTFVLEFGPDHLLVGDRRGQVLDLAPPAYQNTDRLRAELEPQLSGTPRLRLPPDPLAQIVAASAEQTAAARPSRRTRWLVAILFALVIIAVMAVVTHLRGTPEENSAPYPIAVFHVASQEPTGPELSS